jgi:hypothetical protein
MQPVSNRGTNGHRHTIESRRAAYGLPAVYLHVSFFRPPRRDAGLLGTSTRSPARCSASVCREAWPGRTPPHWAKGAVAPGGGRWGGGPEEPQEGGSAEEDATATRRLGGVRVSSERRSPERKSNGD